MIERRTLRDTLDTRDVNTIDTIKAFTLFSPPSREKVSEKAPKPRKLVKNRLAK